jgi:5-methyltetrahydropteroyltriglutamate--homocysteine methyltransferase
VETHVEAINRATVGIPPERIRLHVCWGNYDGPHTHDVPLDAILASLYRARVGALSSS